MKILYLITKSEAGGAQTHVYQLSKFFNGKNDEVVVMAYPGGWLEKECDKIGVKFISNNFFSNKINLFSILKAIKKIKKVVKEFEPDIVHCHSSGAGFIGRLSIRNKIPTIFTAHGWGFNIGVSFLQKNIAIIAEKIVSKYAEKIICVSKFVKDLGIKYKIAGKEKFEVVYNGIEEKVGKFEKNKVGEKIKIIFVGRLAEPKKPLILIKAVESLSEELKEKVEINIVGGGPKKNELEEYIKKNKIKNVTLFGSLPRGDVFDIMLVSDIFILVSKYEGFPMTILEAMNFELPVVASNVGGIKEIVDDGVTGFLLQNNSIEELKEKIKKIVEDEKIINEMGKSSKEKVLKEFSLNIMLEKIEKIYKEILNK